MVILSRKFLLFHFNLRLLMNLRIALIIQSIKFNMKAVRNDYRFHILKHDVYYFGLANTTPL